MPAASTLLTNLVQASTVFICRYSSIVNHGALEYESPAIASGRKYFGVGNSGNHVDAATNCSSLVNHQFRYSSIIWQWGCLRSANTYTHFKILKQFKLHCSILLPFYIAAYAHLGKILARPLSRWVLCVPRTWQCMSAATFLCNSRRIQPVWNDLTEVRCLISPCEQSQPPSQMQKLPFVLQNRMECGSKHSIITTAIFN